MRPRYSDNQFDSEFIEVLRESCFKYISSMDEPVTLSEIAAFVSKRGFSKVGQPAWPRFLGVNVRW